MSTFDLIIIVVVAAMAVFGFLKGFIKSVISLLGFLLSLTIAILLAKAVANALLSVDFFGNMVAGKSGSLFSWLYKKLPAGLEAISTAELGEADNVRELFNQQAPWFLRMFYPLVSSGLTNETYLTALSNARQIMALELAFGVFTLLTGAVLFGLIRVVAAVISIVFKQYTKGRKSLVGRVLGAAIGAGKGVIYCMIILAVFTFVSNFGFMKTINEGVEKSHLAGTLTDASLKITSSVMKGDSGDSRYQRLLELAGFSVEEPAE